MCRDELCLKLAVVYEVSSTMCYDGAFEDLCHVFCGELGKAYIMDGLRIRAYFFAVAPCLLENQNVSTAGSVNLDQSSPSFLLLLSFSSAS